MDVTAPAQASWKRPISAPAAIAIATVALAAFALVLVQLFRASPERLAFELLFLRNEPSAAWLSCIVVAVALAAGRTARGDALIGKLAARPHLFVAAITFCLAAAALLVYRAHPLAMDESAPVFQAGAFARFHLAGKAQRELIARMIPNSTWFIEASPSGELISTYWPGFALLLTPFVWLRCPWLLNPLVGGATLLLLWRIARRLWPDSDAPGWAVLLAAASPAFTVNAISFYSMPAHLCASLAFAALVLEGRIFLAGAIGSLALALHNPLPHALFALPWIAWLAARPDRIRSLLRLAAGYLPGTLLLVVGWFLFRSHFGPGATAHAAGSAMLGKTLSHVFVLPSLETLRDRSANFAELALWAAPGLLPLAAYGAWKCRRQTAARLFAASALVTFAAYLLVVFDQGHGWGYRYFHAAWGALPLLGAGALVAEPAEAGLRRTMLAAALCSLLFCNGLRFHEVRTFMDAHLAQIPEAPPARREIVMVRVKRGYYTIDLVQNDPFLRSPRLMLISLGEKDEADFMRAYFPALGKVAENETASVWQLK